MKTHLNFRSSENESSQKLSAADRIYKTLICKDTKLMIIDWKFHIQQYVLTSCILNENADRSIIFYKVWATLVQWQLYRSCTIHKIEHILSKLYPRPFSSTTAFYSSLKNPDRSTFGSINRLSEATIFPFKFRIKTGKEKFHILMIYT